MPTLPSRLLAAANRVLPAPALPGDADPVAYARWEYETSAPLVGLWRELGGAPARVLDLGCGLGGKTHRLIEEGDPATTVVGLDIDVGHLRGAVAYHRHVGQPGIPKLCGDAARLPFADASFDHILTADTLEHFPRPREVLREMRRCVRDDGRVILLFNPWRSPRGSHLGDLIRLPWCQLLCSRDTLVEATLLAGAQEARGQEPAEAERTLAYARYVVDHFRDHLHPTHIGDLHDWLDEDATFTVEREVRIAPGPLKRMANAPWPEFLTATYGAVLRPRT